VLLAVLALGLAAPLGYALGARAWPFLLGLVALLLLLFGWVERRIDAFRTPRRKPRRAATHLRVLAGGKGNGHAHDDETDDEAPGQGGSGRGGKGDGPGWVM
jgi:hypothetical protein